MAKGYEVFVDDKGGEKIVLANGQELRWGAVRGDEMELEKLAVLERNVFGSGAFGEDRICSARAERGDCGLVLNSDSDFLVNCPSCEAPMEYVFPSDLHIRYLQWIFNHGVKAICLYDDLENIVGFSLMFVAKLNRCFQEINYRQGYVFTDVKESVARCLKLEDVDLQDFVCANRMGIHPDYQGYGLLPFLLSRNAAQIDGCLNQPAIGDTMIHPSGKLFAPVFAAGYNPLTLSNGDLMIDEHGGVLLAIKRFGDFVDALSLDQESFLSTWGERLFFARSLQEKCRHNYPSPGSRKYRNASILRRFDAEWAFQTFEEGEFSEKVLQQLANVFREVFANTFGQYVFAPLNGEVFTPYEIFGDEYVFVDQLDAFDLTAELGLTSHREVIFWHDPQITYDVIGEKLQNKGRLAAFFGETRMEGFCVGYSASFVDVFCKFEEWQNPYLYSGFVNPLVIRNIGTSLEKVNKGLADNGVQIVIDETTNVYVFNAIGFSINFRAKGNLRKLFKMFFDGIGDEMDSQVVFLETKFLSKAYSIFLKVGAFVLNGVLNSDENLQDGDLVMMAGKFKDFRLLLSLPY